MKPANPAVRQPVRFGPDAAARPGSQGPVAWRGKVNETLGIFPALLIWLFYEFGRPSRPLGVPLMLSLALGLTWLLRREKQWTAYSIWWFVLLAVGAAGIPIATNTFSAFWAVRDMAVLFLCICLPLQALVTSVRRARLWIFALLGVMLYVGAWAATHGGYGPAGSDGGQDENYVAAMMGMAIPFAYFSFFAEKKLLLKLALSGSIVVYVAAIALGSNPSRGGFLGLCAVALYCLSRSPKKHIGFGVFAVVGIAFAFIAGPAFWEEIATTTDYTTGTGNARLEIWAAGLRMWAGNPLIGVGADNFRWVIGDYQSAEQYVKFGRSLAGSIIAHSSHVEMIAEVGSLGALATGILVWRTWMGLGKVRKAASPPPGGGPVHPDLVRLRCYADAIRASILAVLVNGIFLSLFYYSHLWLLIAIGTALPFVYRAGLVRVGAAVVPGDGSMLRPSGQTRRRPIMPQPHPPPAVVRAPILPAPPVRGTSA